MTHTTSDVERVNSGSYESVFATLDITSLDNANSEDFDPSSELGVNTVLGVAILGLESPESYVVQFDHLSGNALYVEGYGGTDPTATTDVGEVRIRVDGNPSA